jgi:hypothetical protein
MFTLLHPFFTSSLLFPPNGTNHLDTTYSTHLFCDFIKEK